MAFVPAPGIVEIKFDFTYFGTGGKGFVVHYGKDVPGSWTLTQIDDLLASLVTWWDETYQPLMSPQCTLNRIRARDLTTENGLQSETTEGLPLVGTRTGTPLQAQVVFALKKVTGLTGRSFRGRVYHFGLTASDITGTNNVTTATINALETAWNEALVLVGNEAVYSMGLCSKYTNGQPRVEAFTTVIQRFAAVDSRVDTNRLKLPKGTA